MSRQSRLLRLIEEFVPDPARCAQALLRLLAWEPSADALETTKDVMRDDTRREEPAAQKPLP
jgi:hypothetical protein